ncbi:integrase, partial [Lactiplantibacillus plantarum]
QLKFLDVKDMKILANEVNKNIRLTSTGKSMIYTGLMTGMRVAEVSALTWSDIDWKTKTIRINKSWDYVYGITHTGLKPISLANWLRLPNRNIVTLCVKLENYLATLNSTQ